MKRRFEYIKFRPSPINKYLNFEAIDQIGDTFIEEEDGWFRNEKRSGRVNLLQIDGYKKHYKEIKP